jgi:hypothetical protein
MHHCYTRNDDTSEAVIMLSHLTCRPIARKEESNNQIIQKSYAQNVIFASKAYRSLCELTEKEHCLCCPVMARPDHGREFKAR